MTRLARFRGCWALLSIYVGCASSDEGASSTGGGTSATHGGFGGAPLAGGGGAGEAQGGAGSVLPRVSPFIVVDQFGYLPESEKLAIIRDPELGFDAAEAFTPGAQYALVDAASEERVVIGAASAWNDGAVDAVSGDRVFYFDFSAAQSAGDYYVLDVERGVRSHSFRIADDVYREVLKQAVRSFFYQRAGQEKSAEFAGVGYADAASHVGPLQDHAARLFSDKNNPASERNVWGGWYDGAEFSKYTRFAAFAAEELMRSYAEGGSHFGDDHGIPESSNGVPDVVDEARWGLDYLMRLQNDDGSLISVVAEDTQSPPSAATGQTLYGGVSTSATLAGAAALAYGSWLFRSLHDPSYAAELRSHAERAWTWAEQNPNVAFRNTDVGLGTVEQEVDEYALFVLKLDAATQLLGATEESAYRDYFDANYDKARWFAAQSVSVDDMAAQQTMLSYTHAAAATPSVVEAIRAAYLVGISQNLDGAVGDAYRSYIARYARASNVLKVTSANAFYNVPVYVTLQSAPNFERAAAGYLHYLHGMNPLSLVYLTNMSAYGAENSLREVFHGWFSDGSDTWDRVGESTYGPPPGFFVAGPNVDYDWDACCPSACGSAAQNRRCGSAPPAPPAGQPPLKAYEDFNTGWPLNAWLVSESNTAYQAAYIRLLSKFVK